MLFLMAIVVTGCGDVVGTSGLDTGSIYLTWQAPTLNEDSTVLTDLAGYRVYYGEAPGDYSNVATIGTETFFNIEELPTGVRLYFVVTAFDTSGNESSFSNEVSTILEEIPEL